MLIKGDQNVFSCLEIPPFKDRKLYSPIRCVVNDKFIFLTGGSYSVINMEAIANCFRYDIDANVWQEMQKMR